MRPNLRLPLALVVVVAAAGSATLLLRPREPVRPVRVEVRAYFNAPDLARARAFRRPQWALQAVIALAELGVLALLARRTPRALGRLTRRPLVGGAAVGAALALATGVAPLPVRALARERALDVGLSTQSWPDWAGDVAKSLGIGALFAGAGGAVAVALMRRWPRAWWAPASLVVVLYGAGVTWAAPVVLDPLFNRFERLPAGPLRHDVLALADRAGVDVGEVYRVDASRRTTAANAYVAGLGSTKRVVLYDTLLSNFPRDEVRLVVAHELAHVHHRDVPRGLLFLLLVAPAGMFGVQRLTEALGRGRRGPAAVPALALALALVVPPVTVAGNAVSRRVEARADATAIAWTRAPDAQIGLQRRLTLRNISDPDPPAWVTALLATHPAPIDRIGLAVALRDRAP